MTKNSNALSSTSIKTVARLNLLYARNTAYLSRLLAVGLKQYSTVDSWCLHKITYVLQRDYGINISVGRVYRLMKILSLPRMSTDKPYRNYLHRDNGECTNHLNQDINQKAPDMVWASDFTYIKVVVNGINFAS